MRKESLRWVLQDLRSIANGTSSIPSIHGVFSRRGLQ